MLLVAATLVLAVCASSDADNAAKSDVPSAPAQDRQPLERAPGAVMGSTGKSPLSFLAGRRHMQPVNVSDSVSSIADLTTVKEMESAITDLMMGKSQISATPMGGSVKTIKNLLTKTMMPKVLAAHSADQRLLDRLKGEIGKCASTKASSFRGAETEFTKYKESSRLHKECRAEEASLYSAKKSCALEQQSAYRIKVLKCKAYASVAQQYGTTKNNKEIVNKAGTESVESYISRLSVTFCGKHVHGRTGEISRPGGWGGGLAGGMLDQFLKAKEDCGKASSDYSSKVKDCKRKMHTYNVQKAKCNQYQTSMDGASCQRAVLVKDACESYAGCYQAKLKTYQIAERRVRFDERDRKAEWRGLKRMECLMSGFADGKVTDKEVEACKEKTHNTTQLDITFPEIPSLVKCVLPVLYPATGAYKRAEFAPLPALAKGKPTTHCSGVDEIATSPAGGSPKSCKCTRIALNGYFSAGPIVKCTDCKDIYRSKDKSSCPRGTKLFSPRSGADWKTFLASATPLRAPNWIVDVTRPQNSCGGCTSSPMNSGSSRQKTWRTSDGSAWWLRSTRYSEPNGDYTANCFLDLWRTPGNEHSVTFNDGRCNYHSSSYYCQPVKTPLKPGPGSPDACRCHNVDLAGGYSAGALVKCEQCLTVYRSSQKNSCPEGMKIFSPRTRSDWKTFLSSAGPLRAPHWIIDITRPQNGCGGCTRYAMRSTQPQQATWTTSDKSPWWLRDSRYNEPNGDYKANCFLDLWRTPATENSIQFNDGSCHYRSRSYYCQPVKEEPKPELVVAEPEMEKMLVAPDSLKDGFAEEVFYFAQGSELPSLKGKATNLIRKVDEVNYPNSAGPFSGLSQKENFAMRWTGFLIIRRAGSYVFQLSSDDGSKLNIDGSIAVNNDGEHSEKKKSGTVKLVVGQHSIKTLMFQKDGKSAMQLTYKGPDTGGSYTPMPGKHVMAKGLKESVYYIKDMKQLPDFTQKVATMRIVPHVAYGHSATTWKGFSQVGDFAVRWTGILKISSTGRYRFSIISDDGSKLFINDALLVNNDGLHGLKNKESDYNVELSRNAVRLEYFQGGGKAGMVFRYMGSDSGNKMKYVPSSALETDY